MHGPFLTFGAFAARFCFVAVILILAGCSSDSATKSYSYSPPANPGGRMCTGQCGEAKDYCRQNCDLDHRRCVDDVQAQAIKDYEQYTRDQFAAHQAIELRPRDFERTTGCDNAKKACTDDCEGHYQICYQGCGGKVSTTSSCQSFCF